MPGDNEKCKECKQTTIVKIRQLEPVPAIDSAMYRHGFGDAIETVIELLEGQ